ncbi:MAG: GNAT family N-acetyltransferase [Elusimicrobiales bacterium]
MPGIEFLQPADDADLVRIYETYRACNEPDSPAVPFADLGGEKGRQVLGRLRGINSVVSVNGEKAGFISIVEEKDGINFGFGLFSEYRGRGLMAGIVREAGRYIAARHAGKKITSSTRKGNVAAQKSLLAGGFVPIGSEMKPAAGAYGEPTEYVVFAYERG